MKKRTLLTVLIFILGFSLPGVLEATGRLVKKHKALLKDRVTTKVRTSSRLKRWSKGILQSVPGGRAVSAALDEVTGGSDGEKIDRIEKTSQTNLEKLRTLSRKTLQLKNLAEEVYDAKQRSQKEAKWLSEELKKGSIKKFIGAGAQEGLGFPINPGEHIPSFSPELKKKLDWDLSHEQGFIRANRYLVSDTRAALLDSDLMYTNPEKFEEEYKKAEEHDRQIQEGIMAQEAALTRWRKAEIERLQKENKILEEAKNKPGVKKEEVLLMNMAQNSNTLTISDLQKLVTAQILKDTQLSPQQQQKLAWYNAGKEGKENLASREKRKLKIKKEYAHLNLFK